MVVAHFGVHFGQNRIVLVVLAVSALVFARIGANWLELVRVWKRKKKKKTTWHERMVSSVAHHTPHWCASGVGAAALEPHLCFLGLQRACVWNFL